MGQRRVDKQWPVPRSTRWVWIAQSGPHNGPVQGYVLDWRRNSHRWSALCVIASLDTEGQLIVREKWVPLDNLTPVTSDPNLRPPWNAAR